MDVKTLWGAMSQLYDLNCEIKETQGRYRAIRETGGLSAVSYSPDGASGRTNNISRPTENRAVNDAMLTMALGQLLDAQTEARGWLMMVISQIPDSYDRRVLSLHFYDGKTWDEVAEAMPGHVLGSSVRDRCKRDLASIVETMQVPPVPRILLK